MADSIHATEEWRAVPSYPGYEASSMGRVRSVPRRIIRSDGRPRTIRGQVLTANTSKSGGYPNVRVGHSVTCYVHRLVMEAFAGPCPDGMEVRHLNGDPADNRVANLAYGTSAENKQDIIRHGTHPRWSATACQRGHELTSVIECGHVRRRCLECARATGRRYYLKKKARAAVS